MNAGMMQRLVLCACGHDLGAHAARGCGGDRDRSCTCRCNEDEALEAAIERARIDPWGYFTPGQPIQPAWRRDLAG